MTTRLVFVSHSSQIGGAERYLESVIRYVAENGPREGLHGTELELICRPQRALDEWSSRIQLLGVGVHRLDLRQARDIYRLWRIMRGATLVHLNLAVSFGKYQALSAIVGRIGAQRMIAVHQLLVDAGELGFSRTRNRIWSSVFRLYGNLCDQHIVVSNHDRHRLADFGIPPQRLTLIYNGADLDVFKPLTPAEKAEIKRSVGRELTGEDWGVDTQIICSVGRLVPQKGFDHLLQAAREVVRRYPSARFLVIGEGEEHPVLAQLISEYRLNHNFYLAGERQPPQVSACLGASDIFVLASRHEGLPFAVVEAMASGCPVVASGVDGLLELVADKETGYLVPPSDSTALGVAISELLENPGRARRMGERGRERARRAFDQQESLRRTAQLYRSVIDRRRNQPSKVA